MQFFNEGLELQLGQAPNYLYDHFRGFKTRDQLEGK